MPLDTSLLRTSRQDVKRWKLSRGLGHEKEEEIDNLIDDVIMLEDGRLSKLKELYRSQARLNTCRKLIEPQNDYKQGYDHDILEEIELLKNEQIPRQKKGVQNNDIFFQRTLPILGNLIDDRDFSFCIPSPRKSNIVLDRPSHHFRDFVQDPLICLGGYQLYDSRVNSKSICLSGVGSQLIHAITSYTRNYFLGLHRLERSFCSSSIERYISEPLHAPSDVLLDGNMAHSLMGCLAAIDLSKAPASYKNPCMICKVMDFSNDTKSNSLVNCPSYISLSLLHRDKIYYDHQLPKSYICTVTNEPKLSTKAKASRRLLLSNRLGHCSQSIEVLVLTSSSLAVSSKIQDDTAYWMISFCKTLVSSVKDGVSFYPPTVNDPDETWIRTRIVPPNLLNMNEARRIVIEGHVPCKNLYVEIAHVSNYTDYLSRGLNIQAGRKKDFAHIVHGFMDTVVLLDFILENNVACLGDKHYGVLLPQGLTDYMSTTSINPIRVDGDQLFIPFIRRMVQGKNGKMSTVEMQRLENHPQVSLSDQPLNTNVITSKDNNQQSDFRMETQDKQHQKPPKMPLFDPTQSSPSSQETEFESLSSFSFLPFY